jgi:hypothetical protein
MNENDWLQTLKAGDQVIVRRSGYRSIDHITAVTPTQVVIRSTRYNKSDGRERGQDYYGSTLQPADADALAEMADEKRRNVLLNGLREQFGSLRVRDTATLESLWKILAPTTQGVER